MCGFQGTKPEEIPVVMAKGIHLFPYRTQKLSLSAPMVLGWRRPGRVGHCRIPKRTRPHRSGVLFFLDLEMIYLPGRLQLSPTLYLVGTGACRRQWRKQAGGASGIARSACATMRVPRALTSQTRTPGSAHCKASRQPVCLPLTGRLPTKANARGAFSAKMLTSQLAYCRPCEFSWYLLTILR